MQMCEWETTANARSEIKSFPYDFEVDVYTIDAIEY